MLSARGTVSKEQQPSRELRDRATVEPKLHLLHGLGRGPFSPSVLICRAQIGVTGYTTESAPQMWLSSSAEAVKAVEDDIWVKSHPLPPHTLYPEALKVRQQALMSRASGKGQIINAY